MPRIVILGAGFGGLFAAKKLAGVAADVTVIDRHNYHLFQPLLYQVATAGLPPSDIAWPIRSILSRQKNTSVLLDEVMDINVGQHEVILQNESVTFDYLVVATGSTHSYFGHETDPGNILAVHKRWLAPHCLGLAPGHSLTNYVFRACVASHYWRYHDSDEIFTTFRYRGHDKCGRGFFRQRSIRSSIFATPTHMTLSAPPQ